jgi:hypothetical protein
VQLHRPDILKQLAELEGWWLVFSFAKMVGLQSWIPHFRDNFLLPYYQENGLEPSGELFARTRFIADPSLEIYHAYGLGRNKITAVYSRQILRQYARWRAEGKPVHWPQEDPLQRGGNFVVNRAGRLTLAHSGRDQSERPTPSQILESMRER